MAGDIEGVARRAAQCAMAEVDAGAARRAAQQVEERFEGRRKQRRHEALLATVKGRDRACTCAQEVAASGRNEAQCPAASVGAALGNVVHAAGTPRRATPSGIALNAS